MKTNEESELKKKHVVKYFQDSAEMEIDGVRYVPQKAKNKKIDGVTHLEYGIFVPKSDKIIEKRNFIIEKLKSQIPPERVIEELLKGFSGERLSKLYNILKKKNPTIKRHDGCLGINIDGGKGNKMYLGIFD